MMFCFVLINDDDGRRRLYDRTGSHEDLTNQM